MKFGTGIGGVWWGPPVVETAKAAEDLGFESLWIGEHIIIPVDVSNPMRHGTMLPDFYKHLVDPFIWMAAAATATTHVKLGTQVCLVPQRNPLILAKELACLDVLSGGRIILGAGFGWIKEEAEIFGYELRERWEKTTEHIRALKVLWKEEVPSFEGKYVNFPPLYSYPKPVQEGGVPVIIGAGMPESKDRTAILKRVADVADGWQPGFLSPAEIAGDLKILKDLCDERGRDFSAMDITLLVPGIRLGFGEAIETMGTLDKKVKDPLDLVGEYEEAGVKRIILGLAPTEGESRNEQLERVSKALGLT